MRKAVITTAFCFSSKMFLIVFCDDTVFPDTLHRKENDLFFQKSIPDVCAPDIPIERAAPAKVIQVSVQKVFARK